MTQRGEDQGWPLTHRVGRTWVVQMVQEDLVAVKLWVGGENPG